MVVALAVCTVAAATVEAMEGVQVAEMEVVEMVEVDDLGEGGRMEAEANSLREVQVEVAVMVKAVEAGVAQVTTAGCVVGVVKAVVVKAVVVMVVAEVGEQEDE